MTYWDGDRWVVEATTERARREQRIPRSLVAFVVAGVVVALVLARQAATPVSTDRTAGTVPSSGQHGDMLQTGPRYVVSRATGGSVTSSSTASAQKTSAPASSSAACAPSLTLAVVPATGTTVYIHYYLWWTKQHWQDKLGAAYPYSAAPLPLPGLTDASGCSPKVSYPGATIVDIPSQGL